MTQMLSLLRWAVRISLGLSAIILFAIHSDTTAPRIHRDFGRPTDAEVLVRTKSATFRLPAIYLGSWPTPTQLKQPHLEWPAGLGFVFWFPDLSGSTTKTVPPLLHPRPKEPNRPQPVDGEFRVSVSLLHFTDGRQEEALTVAKRIENVESLSAGREPTFDLGGLECVRSRNPNAPTCVYVSDKDPDLMVIMRCIGEPGTLNPLCVGNAHFRRDQFAFRFMFTAPQIARWREVATSVRTLALRWRTNE